jgi:hypothetical protein
MKSIIKISLFFLIHVTVLSADIIHVPADTSTIQGGIYRANEKDTVLVAEGTYYENINFRGKAITVASQFIMDDDTSHISKTIIDGSQPTNPDSGSVVCIMSGEDSTSVLMGFTITGGTGTIHHFIDVADGSLQTRRGGGGIFIESSGAKIRYNIIKNNIIETELYANGTAIMGWFVPDGHTILIEDNTIANNSMHIPANSGGTVNFYNGVGNGGLYVVKKNTILNNTVTCTGAWKAWGGGVAVFLEIPCEDQVFISENRIFNNKLYCQNSFGAGINVALWMLDNRDDFNINIFIYNNIISKNYSQLRGAGITVWNIFRPEFDEAKIVAKPAIINNTIVDNFGEKGSGIYCYNTTPLIMNSIIWNKVPEEGAGEIDFSTAGYGLFSNTMSKVHGYHSVIQGGWEGLNNLDICPAFKDTSQGDYSLTDSSVCVGWGLDSVIVEDTWYYCRSKDYYGNVRPDPIDRFVDVGAIESPYERNPLAIKSTTHGYPIKFNLQQSYPNPFNPSTTIEFTLPSSVFVILKIYNILGEEITTLVNGNLKAGNHSYQFDGSHLASGIYLYRIQAGHFKEVRKMMLLK